ncbi:MAG: efflux RND transporter periplasmic adaptor subunit [Bacteroidetes bacterium]|nr:efflux RND transporter periplasmic adaptor subunit [Bacteroidota bacterium]
MKRNILYVFFGVFILFSCKKKYETSYVKEQDITESVYASGIIKGKNQYQVFSTVNGIIEKVFVSEGDFVSVNQPILKILNNTVSLNADNARLQAEYNDFKQNNEKLEEYKSNIELLKIKLRTDSLMYQRQLNLWKNNIGSKIELEQRELAFKNSKTSLESAILKFNDLKKQLSLLAAQSKNNMKISNDIFDDFTIKSRINGRVYNMLKEEGELVNTMSPVAILGDVDSFLIELQIDEYDISKIQKGQEVLLTMDSYKSKVFEAKVSKILPSMNPSTRSFTIEAHFTKPPPIIFPNTTTEANILIRKIKKALTIDRNYLIDDSFVYINKSDKILVKTGLKDLKKVEIIKGLKNNDKIYLPLK